MFAYSDTDYMRTDIFQDWLQRWFVLHCDRARPVILVPISRSFSKNLCLILHNHVSHIRLPLIECARRNAVILGGIPSHTTHLIHPLDVHVNGPLKEKVLSLLVKCVSCLCLILSTSFHKLSTIYGKDNAKISNVLIESSVYR